jgi:N-6 DNA Methylase
MSKKRVTAGHPVHGDVHQQALVDLIQNFPAAHRTYSVFSDFVELSALSISNSVDRQQFDAREKRYLEIVKKYRKDHLELFTRMFGELVLSLEHRVDVMHKSRESGGASMGLTDVLGEVFMQLDMGNDRAGQFFTPYHVSRLMAMMTVGLDQETIQRNGFIRACEPAVGAGGMVIAMAESMQDAGLNYQETLHVTCVDIDAVCVHMAYLQLSLLHIPALVVHGNSLSMEVWGMWYTPAHVLGGWRWKLRVRDKRLAAEAVSAAAETDVFERTADELVVVAPESAEGVADASAIASAPVNTMELEVAPDSGGTALLDLFESVADAMPSNEAFFRKVEQLALF